MHDRARRTAILFAAIAVTGWGMTGVLVRLVPGMPATFITSVRQIVALACMLPALSRRTREIIPTIRHGITWKLAASLNAFFLFAVLGFQRATVSEVTLFIATAPVWILIASAITGARIARHEWIGTASALAGVAIMTVPHISFAGAASRQHVLGEFLALFAAMGSAGYAAQFRTAHIRDDIDISPTVVTAFSFALGGTLLLIATALLGKVPLAAAMQPHNAAILIAIGICSTAVPSFTFAKASQALPPVVTTTTQLMIPVLATLFAAVVLREWPPKLVVPGGVLVLAGTWYSLRGRR
jgi:drug/metabolite transporter (DMT)-like permease